MWGAEVPWPLVEPEVEPSLYPLCLAVWVAQGWSSGGQGGWLRGAKWAQGLELAKSCRHSGDSVSWPRRTAGRRGTALFTDPGPELQPPSARPARTRGWTQAGAVGHGRESWLRNLRDHLLDGEQAGSRRGQAGRERAFGGSQILHPWTWPRAGKQAAATHSQQLQHIPSCSLPSAGPMGDGEAESASSGGFSEPPARPLFRN